MKIAGNNKLHVPNVVSCTQNITKATRITVAAVVAHHQALCQLCLEQGKTLSFFCNSRKKQTLRQSDFPPSLLSLSSFLGKTKTRINLEEGWC